jgi:hypothetical protein
MDFHVRFLGGLGSVVRKGRLESGKRHFVSFEMLRDVFADACSENSEEVLIVSRVELQWLRLWLLEELPS